MVLDRESADDEGMARLISGAGLVYLSGGSPGYLADTLRETRVWAAIVEEWGKGAALAGCSAGAMALTGWVPDIRRPDGEPRPGLDALPMLRVMPHFDRLMAWAPQMAESMAALVPPGVTLVGIDEETAIRSDGADLRRWVVHGRQAAWLFTPAGRTRYGAGEEIVL
jgi:cyanophycinase-like exopeptidase